MKVRTKHAVRLNQVERRLLEAAARRIGVGYSTYMRQAALERAVDQLEDGLDDVRPSEASSEELGGG